MARWRADGSWPRLRVRGSHGQPDSRRTGAAAAATCWLLATASHRHVRRQARRVQPPNRDSLDLRRAQRIHERRTAASRASVGVTRCVITRRSPVPHAAAEPHNMITPHVISVYTYYSTPESFRTRAQSVRMPAMKITAGCRSGRCRSRAAPLPSAESSSVDGASCSSGCRRTPRNPSRPSRPPPRPHPSPPPPSSFPFRAPSFRASFRASRRAPPPPAV